MIVTETPKAPLSQFRDLQALVRHLEAQVRELRIRAGLEQPEEPELVESPVEG